jgi:hypothetical protein
MESRRHFYILVGLMDFQESAEHYARCYVLMDGQFCGGLASSDDVLKETLPDLRKRRMFQAEYIKRYRKNMERLSSLGYKPEHDTESWWEPFYHKYPGSPDAEKCLQELVL